MAAWIRKTLKKQLGIVPKFFDSNNLKPMHLDVVDEKDTAKIQEEYVRIFKKGIWRCVRTVHNKKEATKTKRLYIGGSITLKL